ncbi:hypothetical protein CIB95_15300 [Lottiidibacillus patelloidae]|uniref:Lipoprotein n=1 Tax=Lottiidibacillus patelloidae TaxID=2670334 RepID=A0A263BPX1_9BACI|nr:hypothetical protein [Lottiidibacillus patelloidae]OZM55801.1 hypothetical protein CIB95_15300 [Lottiidibacillus patelloidae]
MKKLILLFVFMLSGCSSEYELMKEDKVANIVDKVYQHNCLSELGFRGSTRYALVGDRKGICILIGEKDNQEVLYTYGKKENEKYIDTTNLYSYKNSLEYINNQFNGIGTVEDILLHMAGDASLNINPKSIIYDKIIYSFRVKSDSGVKSNYMYFSPYTDELKFYTLLKGEIVEKENLETIFD